MPKKIIIGTLVFIIVYTIFGFLILPAVLRSVLTKNLSENLHRTVSIKEIKTNPYIISARIKGLAIKDQQNQKTFASVSELYVNIQIESLLKRALVIEEISISKPYVNITRKTQQLYNFSDLIKEDGKKADTKKEPFRFFIGNIQVSDGRIDFMDSPKNKQHEVKDIAFALPFLSNMKKTADTFVQPYFRANINGAPFVLEGRSKPFARSLETIFNINLKRIDIPHYMEYLPKEIEVRIPSGTIDLQADLSYVQSQDKPPVIHVSGILELNNLAVNDTKGLPLVRLSELAVKITDIQLPERNAHLSAINLISPEVYVRRDKAGELNIEAILRKINAENTEVKTESKPFPVKIDQVELNGGVVSFSDVSTADPVNLLADKLKISAHDIDTTAGGMADLSCRLNKKGIISTNTTFKIDPLSCDAKVSVEGIEPGWVQSYFTDQIRIIITGGRVSTKGLFTMRQDKTKLTQLSYKGNAALADFASVDKENKDDFVKIKMLNLKTLNVGFNPTYVDIKEIALKDFFTGIIINDDKKLNLKSVVKQDQDTVTIPEEKDKNNKSTEKILIGKISVKNGNIRFIDRSISPNFSTELTNIEGSITGLTSLDTEAAKVELSGKLDNDAPLMITGSINPFKDDLFVNLHTNFKDIDLSPESPYSGKFLGYTINKGKLTLDLKYLISKKNLDSQNNVYIDQFTFGNSVNSPDSTSLPVRLAVSLLKDHNGKINLNLPVAGRTDDPEFSVWKIIIKMLVNLVGKAATAPFSLLTSLYPGADQLSNVDFEYGKADLSSQIEAKLQLLHQILADKPSVSLEIKGYAGMEKDRQAIIQYLFGKKIKAQKLIKIIKKGQPVITVDEVSIAPDEYELYLTEAYKAEIFPKPQKTKGQPEVPAASEMEELIIDHIQVTESALKLLAQERALQVKNFLLKSQQINPERIFLVEGEIISEEKSDDVSAAHVELTLK
ncbi:MAG: DUF748 domain-containing protein [Proteobacteria bacterium]|nr:DUF748 domain-containing protein [Pseudomonadota bacterium]